MPVSGATVVFLRGLLAALTILFAHYLGRTWLRVLRGAPKSTALTWTLRTTVALLGLMWWRGLDALAIVAIVLAAASCAAGVYLEKRPPKQEHLEDIMFSDD
jgi:hypothetical protein